MLRKKVGEIVSPRLVSLTTATPVGQAVDTMREQNISCIVVTEHHHLAGIFTERNIVEYAVQQDFDFSGHTLGEVMSTSVHTVTPDDFIYTAYSNLVKHRIRHLVVIDGDRPCGVLTQSDIVAHLGSEYFVDIKKISQIMSRQLFTTSGQATVQEALQIMAERAVSCLVVTEDERPLGILTERDVARLVGVSKDIRTQPVAKFMSTPVRTVPLEMPVYEAATLLRSNGIRRLVIVDATGRIQGLTTQSDIVRGLEGKYIEILNQVVREKDSELQDASR
ncbi:MAG: cyclic nucleotide-binding/CBS domain-containing protein, partial [Desulfohalobiaceae bacterium]